MGSLRSGELPGGGGRGGGRKNGVSGKQPPAGRLQADGDLKKLLLPPGNGFFSEPLERYFTGAAPDPGKRRPGIFKDRG